jgi:hypothetical protein
LEALPGREHSEPERSQEGEIRMFERFERTEDGATAVEERRVVGYAG